MAKRAKTIRPDLGAFHRSLATELMAVKNRVRNLSKHWGTDGEYKELALRSVLRRHVPDSIHVGRGFIVTEEKTSPQIDVLLVDARSPTLFRDGDLFFVTPDAVRAIIEVKTKFAGANAVPKAIGQLLDAASCCNGPDRQDVWTGLFSFENRDTDALHEQILGQLRQQCTLETPIHCVSAGAGTFVRWWGERENRLLWRSYGLKDLAPAYFIGNLVYHLNGRTLKSHSRVWFPVPGEEGKESRARFTIDERSTEARMVEAYARTLEAEQERQREATAVPKAATSGIKPRGPRGANRAPLPAGNPLRPGGRA